MHFLCHRVCVQKQKDYKNVTEVACTMNCQRDKVSQLVNIHRRAVDSFNVFNKWPTSEVLSPI